MKWCGLAIVLMLTGCSHALGYAGQHPGYFKCKGKVGITGSGTLALGAGYGGASTNSFSLNGDCGEGFEFSQGKPAELAPEVPVK